MRGLVAKSLCLRGMPTASFMAPLRIALHPTERPLSATERQAKMVDPTFGRVFVEHMVKIVFDEARGWHDAQVTAYGPLELDPAASVLHYGQAIFEGFKAYRQADGGVATFRPAANAKRFAASAERLAMPPLPQDLFIAAADALIRQDRAWVPPALGESLYLRPLMIATEAALGVRPAKEYLFLLIGSPAGAYFKNGIKPVSVWITRDYVRAAKGGTGDAKCAGNYAASLIAQRQALDAGCDQVVWLDANEHRFVEEMGGMNLFFVYGSGKQARLLTPALTGSLLPGVTRDSLLTLARDLGYHAEEGTMTVEQWQRDAESGAMTEAFACGTAAVITPLGTVKGVSGSFSMGGGGTGPVAGTLRERLLAVQHGHAPDAHGWMHPVVLD